MLANPSAGDLSAIAAEAAWVEEPVPGRPGPEPPRWTTCPTPACRARPTDLEVCVRVSGAGPRILLVGDSQAAMFVDALEALAKEQDFTLLTNIVRGCGWQAGLVQDASPEEQAACTAVTRDVLRRRPAAARCRRGR